MWWGCTAFIQAIARHQVCRPPYAKVSQSLLGVVLAAFATRGHNHTTPPNQYHLTTDEKTEPITEPRMYKHTKHKIMTLRHTHTNKHQIDYCKQSQLHQIQPIRHWAKPFSLGWIFPNNCGSFAHKSSRGIFRVVVVVVIVVVVVQASTCQCAGVGWSKGWDGISRVFIYVFFQQVGSCVLLGSW